MDLSKYQILKQIILIANKWQERADQVVVKQLGLTLKQWMLLGVLEEEYKNHLPTLSEAAESFGTSRQNTKRLALELQKKGYLIIANDPSDHRILRLALTGKHRDFFMRNKHIELFDEISGNYFENLEENELSDLQNSLSKLVFKLQY